MFKVLIACGLVASAAAQTAMPSYAPTEAESMAPSYAPTVESFPYEPSATPTAGPPTIAPTTSTEAPTAKPTMAPTVEPSAAPTLKPSEAPTGKPSAAPTAEPSATPTVKPSELPTTAPTGKPSATPTGEPSAAPTLKPSEAPTGKPTTPAPTTETDAPTGTPAPTGVKASDVVITLDVTALTLADCIASKDAFVVTFSQQLGIAASRISVICQVPSSTRRRLQGGDLVVEVVVACGPDAAEFCDDVEASANDLTTTQINDGLQQTITDDPSLDPTGSLAGTTVDDTAVEQIPAADFDETDSPLAAPTAAPVTLAPTDDKGGRRTLTQEFSINPAHALHFIDYGAPGTGMAADPRRRLFSAAKGCQSPEWAEGQCAILLSDVPSVCGEWSDCAGAICGGKGFDLDGKPACLAMPVVDYGATPRKDVYALVKDSSDLLGFLKDAQPPSRKLLFAAAAYGSEVLSVLHDIWHA